MKEVSMDKKKEIEELTKTIIEHHCYQHGCDYCGWYESRKGCEDKLIYADLARYLIEEAGYRKADEVRKETLKEIFSWLHIRTKNGRVIDDTVLIKTAKETFGVEVDEIEIKKGA